MTLECPFLEHLTFSSLIAPISEEEFRTSYWEKKPLVVHRQCPDYYGNLFTLSDFDEAVTRAPSYIKTVDTTNKKGTVKQFATVAGLEAVLADMRDGASLILEQLQRNEPKLGLLCRLLGQELGHTFETNLYLTAAHGKSSVPHWDNTDVFILQVLGSKHWKIENERRIFPVRPFRMGADVREFQGDFCHFTVHPGDLIYIPRGFMHMAECGSETSLHISLGLVPAVLEDFLHAIIKVAVQRDERLRMALPLGFMRDGGEDIAQCARAALLEAADSSFLGNVLDLYRDELIKTHELDVSGQIADHFQPVPLRLDDVVGPRRGVVWRMHVDQDAVGLNVGTRRITFPEFFRQSLDFSLNAPAYSIRDIPGELEDQERIALVERLMQEGLLIRKRKS